MTDRFFIRLFAVFGILNGILFIFKPQILAQGMHVNILMTGNVLLAIVTLVSYLLSRQGLASANNNAFVRAVYGSMLLKFFLSIVGIAAYVLSYRPNVSKLTVFTLLFFYLIYTVFETFSLFKLTRLKK